MNRNIFHFSIITLSILAALSIGNWIRQSEASETWRQEQVTLSGFKAPSSVNLHALSSTSVISSSKQPAEPFLWVNYGEEQDYAGYKRVLGGTHADGSRMYICRAKRTNGMHPGKLYKNRCMVPWNGQENVFPSNYQVLLTNTGYQWPDSFNLSPAQIEESAITGGNNNKEALYICRKQLKDGLHPGKYLISSGLCYVAWGGKETTWTNGFQILTP